MINWKRRARRIPIQEVMATVRCTTKLLKELGTKPTIAPAQPSSLSDWHANLLRIERKKYVLFTNDQTLYSFLIHLARRPVLADFIELFRLGLLKSLLAEGLDDTRVAQTVGGQGPTIITRTSSRSVLGSMNDVAFQTKYMVHYEGGLANVDFVEIGREINRVPMKAINYNGAIEELKRRLDEPESGTSNRGS